MNGESDIWNFNIDNYFVYRISIKAQILPFFQLLFGLPLFVLVLNREDVEDEHHVAGEFPDGQTPPYTHSLELVERGQVWKNIKNRCFNIPYKPIIIGMS